MAEISVILPVYNTSKYLHACLSSLLNQTFHDFEIVAINDGSTDDSLSILQDFANKDSRIRIIDQKNQGIGAARNLGIQLANGTYIAFIDSDDTLELRMLECLYKKAVEESLDIVVCDYIEYEESSKKEEQIALPTFETCSLLQMPQLLFEINSSPWNKLYRTALWKEHGIEFPVSLKYEDAYAVLLCLVKAKHIGKVNEPLMKYWIHEGSESTVMDARVFDIFEILTNLKVRLQEDEKYDTIAPYLTYFTINRITVYMLQQKYQKDAALKRKFIEQGYAYLNQYDFNWRNHPMYVQSNTFVKRMIKNHQWLMKLYVGG